MLTSIGRQKSWLGASESGFSHRRHAFCSFVLQLKAYNPFQNNIRLLPGSPHQSSGQSFLVLYHLQALLLPTRILAEAS